MRRSVATPKNPVVSLVGDGKPPLILYAEHIVGHGEKLFAAMCEAGQEGIIAKTIDGKMPSFFAYLVYSCLILLPILAATVWLFLT